MTILGIHHISLICANAQRTKDFYTQVLGQRLVKQTVNFDDPSSYHLYFGNRTGQPETLVTFFEWPSAGEALIGSYAGTRLMLLGVLAAVYQRKVPVLQVPTAAASFVHDTLNIGIVYKAKVIDETADLVLAHHGLHRRAEPAAAPITRSSPPNKRSSFV